MAEGDILGSDGYYYQLSYVGGDGGRDITFTRIAGGNFSFSAPRYSVNEGDGTATVTIRSNIRP